MPNSSHIITSSNASNKKLAFQGWDKCVEAFSQGKDSLSYYCAQLINSQEPFEQEGLISWSSSDEGSDGNVKVSRSRPNRTLTSQIDFSDCTSLRKKGRRQTSARFSRNIEKHSHKINNENPCSNIQCSDKNKYPVKKLQGNTKPTASSVDSSPDFSMRSLSSPFYYSDCNEKVVIDASLLNKRIVIDDTQINETSLGSVCAANESVTPGKRKENENVLPESSSSPIFKFNKTVYRRKICSAGISEKTSNKVVRAPEKELVQHSNHDNLKQNEDRCAVPVIDGPTSPEPTPLKLQGFGSPVLGHTVGKRKKSVPKMIIDEPISPILGKLKGPSTVCAKNSPILGRSKRIIPHRQRKKSNCRGVSHKDKDSCKASNVHDTKTSKADEVKTCGPSVLFQQWSQVGAEEESIEDNMLSSVDGISAKRSLDFSSVQDLDSGLKYETCLNTDLKLSSVKHVEMSTEYLCNTPDSDIIESSQGKCSQNFFQKLSLKEMSRLSSDSSRPGDCFSNQQKISRQSCENKTSPSGYSMIIEEVNTEQLGEESFHRDPPKSLSDRKPKRKSLSLKKKPVNCESSSTVVKNISSKQISSKNSNSEKVHQVLTLTDEKLLCSEKCDSEENFSKQSIMKETVAMPQNRDCLQIQAKSTPNFSCYIEDVNSESFSTAYPSQVKETVMEFDPYNKQIVSSLKNQQNLEENNQNQTLLDYRQHSIRGHHSSGEDAFEIDSCSSQSPEDAPDINKSNRVTSPVSISQSSSPRDAYPISPCDQPLPVDDFETPAKKGKKKLQPGGLAHRLQRLLNRQRSSASIWKFQRSKHGRKNSESNGGINIVSDPESNATHVMVHHTWIEYSRVLVEGFLTDEKNDKSVLLSSVVVVLDQSVAERLGSIRTACMIRIFPPWQSLTLKETSVILCVTRVEVVSMNVPPKNFKSGLTFSKEFHCPCVDGLLQQVCSEHNGLLLKNLNDIPIKVLDIIFPENQQNNTCSLMSADEKLAEISRESNNIQETVSQLVTHYLSGGTTSNRLTGTVLRVFMYCQLLRKVDEMSSPTWSLLVRDASGDVCEITLGSKSSSESVVWNILESDQMLGNVYQFSELIPTKRIYPFRASSLWSVVKNVTSGSYQQSVLYVLSPSASLWHCKLIQDGPSPSLDFSKLQNVITTDLSEPCRFNIVCRLLHFSRDNLYVTDSSVTPHVSVITLQNSAYVPFNISKAVLLALHDIEVLSGEIRADRYSRIHILDVQTNGGHLPLNVEQLNCLSALNPKLPLLHFSSSPRTLATLVGNIVGVDEESAFMWPACGHCGNELLCIGPGSETYRCRNCVNHSEKVALRMSLQVILSCENFPRESVIRIKLLQSTIEKLLPPSPCTEEGYDMNTVLGRELGPLNCEVLSSQGGNFLLQELQPFN